MVLRLSAVDSWRITSSGRRYRSTGCPFHKRQRRFRPCLVTDSAKPHRERTADSESGHSLLVRNSLYLAFRVLLFLPVERSWSPAAPVELRDDAKLDRNGLVQSAVTRAGFHRVCTARALKPRVEDSVFVQARVTCSCPALECKLASSLCWMIFELNKKPSMKEAALTSRCAIAHNDKK